MSMRAMKKKIGGTSIVHISSKFDSGLATAAMDWVKTVCEGGGHANAVVNIPTQCNQEKCVQSALQSGIILCILVNLIKRGSVKKINTGTASTALTPHEKMENINNFLFACENIGMYKGDLFGTADLYDAKDIPRVIKAIWELHHKATEIGFVPPRPKETTEGSGTGYEEVDQQTFELSELGKLWMNGTKE